MLRNFLLKGLIISYVYDGILFIFLGYSLASSLNFGYSSGSGDYGWGSAIMFIWLWPTFHLILTIIMSVIYSFKTINKLFSFLKFFIIFTLLQILPLVIWFFVWVLAQLTIRSITHLIFGLGIIFATQVMVFLSTKKLLKA